MRLVTTPPERSAIMKVVYGIHLLNPYKTVLSHLKRCVHLGQQMSSNFTVKWVWIFFACQQESPFHGFANSSLIISDLILWPDSPNPSTERNFGLLDIVLKISLVY